ncbi:SufS family cysteine desulfurase [Candidatus Dependentiae bacterium]|nr:SufS family cysteine desulfurase [Candidatus Dependentiae bacterium]
MKRFQEISFWIIILSFFKLDEAKEFGIYDGGEYYKTKDIENAAGDTFIDLRNLVTMPIVFCRSGDSSSGDLRLDDLDLHYWDTHSMDFDAVRDQFPIFKTVVNDKSTIYLDSASTAQMPKSVIDAIVEYYQTYRANVGRGLYLFAEKSTQMFELSRMKVARFINADASEIIFTAGATSAINLAAHIWVENNVKAGDEIVISEVEHNANFIPWQQLAKQTGVVLKRVPLNARGVVDVETFKQYITSKTKFVALTHQSNILGMANDVKSLIAQAHQVGAKVLIDGAQSIAHQKIDVKDLDCDFFVFSGHKLFGPTGVGVLFMKKSLLPECKLCNFGGGMVYAVTPESTEFKSMPYCFEPGTQAIAQVIGLGAAVDFIQKNINFAQVQEHETKLVCKLAAAVSMLPGITILSPVPEQGEHSCLVTFTSDRYHAYDIAEFLNQHGIAVRAGFHCVQPYHDKMGGSSSVRVSISVYNTDDEIDCLIGILKKMF